MSGKSNKSFNSGFRCTWAAATSFSATPSNFYSIRQCSSAGPSVGLWLMLDALNEMKQIRIYGMAIDAPNSLSDSRQINFTLCAGRCVVLDRNRQFYTQIIDLRIFMFRFCAEGLHYVCIGKIKQVKIMFCSHSTVDKFNIRANC